MLTALPPVVNAIINYMEDFVKVQNVYLCGCGSFGNTLASILAVKYNMPLLIMREKPKNHGEEREIIGLYEKDIKECILIDDVFTSGTTVLEIRDKFF